MCKGGRKPRYAYTFAATAIAFFIETPQSVSILRKAGSGILSDGRSGFWEEVLVSF